MRKMFFVFSVFIVSNSFAALPPYYQSTAEIFDILNNKTLIRRLGIGAPINSFEKTATGYVVSAGNCSASVQVKYLPPPPNFIGPAKFTTIVGKVFCE